MELRNTSLDRRVSELDIYNTQPIDKYLCSLDRCQFNSRYVFPEYVFTLDCSYTKNKDDAISIVETGNGYILFAHVTDLSDYICNLNELLNKSRFSKLTKKRFSFEQETEREAVTLGLHFDRIGSFDSYKFFRSKIKIDNNLNFDIYDNRHNIIKKQKLNYSLNMLKKVCEFFPENRMSFFNNTSSIELGNTIISKVSTLYNSCMANDMVKSNSGIFVDKTFGHHRKSFSRYPKYKSPFVDFFSLYLCDFTNY